MRKIDLVNFQVATNETAREINSRAMLNLVREHQPISRADLMRYSGLQRSTVSVITGQLIADRWLKQGQRDIRHVAASRSSCASIANVAG